MTNDEFKQRLNQFRYYLKPALFTVLAENVDVFSDQTKDEIIAKLMEADNQVKELSDYQEKRNGLLRKGLQKIEDVYSNVKAKFQAMAKEQGEEEAAAAEKLINNL